MKDSSAPIGIFDSGVGGLTVFAALRARLPHENLVYLGDTARVPYGTKSAHVVQRYAHTCTSFLIKKGAKLLVVACNTASAFALDFLTASWNIPIIGVVEPGARLAATASEKGFIGVIGTEGTIKSNSYQQAILKARPNAQVTAKSCPLFVPLAEEGMVKHPATRLIAEEYLHPMMALGIDTLILGCTHYPILTPLLREILGPNIHIIDSAKAVAQTVEQSLQQHQLTADKNSPVGINMFFATDVSQRVERVGSAFLGHDLGEVTLVDL